MPKHELVSCELQEKNFSHHTLPPIYTILWTCESVYHSLRTLDLEECLKDIYFISLFSINEKNLKVIEWLAQSSAVSQKPSSVWEARNSDSKSNVLSIP